MKEGFNMFKGIKRYFRKSVINVNYELKYEKEIILWAYRIFRICYL